MVGLLLIPGLAASASLPWRVLPRVQWPIDVAPAVPQRVRGDHSSQLLLSKIPGSPSRPNFATIGRIGNPEKWILLKTSHFVWLTGLPGLCSFSCSLFFSFYLILLVLFSFPFLFYLFFFLFYFSFYFFFIVFFPFALFPFPFL